MKRLFQILLAVAFGILLIEIYFYTETYEEVRLEGIYELGIFALPFAFLYYYLFERKKKK